MVAGVDIGNATTEVVIVAGGEILGAGRVPTRGRKGSACSRRRPRPTRPTLSLN